MTKYLLWGLAIFGAIGVIGMVWHRFAGPDHVKLDLGGVPGKAL